MTVVSRLSDRNARNRCAALEPVVETVTLRSSEFRFKRPSLMYIPTKTPRKLDRKRSKLLRSKFKAKNNGRRQQLKK